MMQLKGMGESQSRSIWYRKLFEKIKKEDLDKFEGLLLLKKQREAEGKKVDW